MRYAACLLAAFALPLLGLRGALPPRADHGGESRAGFSRAGGPAAGGPSVAQGGGADTTFSFPAPATLPRARRLWATHYYVYGVQAAERGEPLLNPAGQRLGPLLSPRDWCLGAIEGTVRVTSAGGEAGVYNYAGRGAAVQVQCAPFIGARNIDPAQIGRTRFARARGRFGDGVRGMVLVPFRTIAVDPAEIPIGSVVYVPAARGRAITLPSGRAVTHDGYFFAADVGGAIRGSHIDVFGGVSRANPFPGFVHSTSSRTFDAYVVGDDAVRESLRRVHLPR